MCGIFAYLHYNIKRDQVWIVKLLLTGLRRLEYRGYDSAGICIDKSTTSDELLIFKAKGNIDALEQSLPMSTFEGDERQVQATIAHTRWATHGEPAPRNAHPQSSDATNSFVVVHNGIINNFSVLKETLSVKHGYRFVSDTDTEVIAVLLLYIYENVHTTDNKKPSFRELVSHATAHLDGAFAVLVKSRFYPGELVATKVGSPLIIGLMDSGAEVEGATRSSIPITVTSKPAIVNTKGADVAYIDLSVASSSPSSSPSPSPLPTTVVESTVAATAAGSAPVSKKKNVKKKKTTAKASSSTVATTASTSTTTTYDAREYLCSSDIAAIIEHTNRAIFLEDYDVAHFTSDGVLHMMHRKRLDATATASASASAATNGVDESAAAAAYVALERPITTLEGEMDSLSKAAFDHFMLKEIYEQADTVFNTMRGRVNFDSYTVTLGGLATHLESIRRSRRLIFIACGTSYNAAIATRQLMEELSLLPVDVQLASDFLDRQTPIFRDECCFFVSQSGETADTLMALNYCLKRGALTVGIVNRVASAIARATACGVYTNAGLEVGVASTKAYTSQIIAMVLIAIAIGQDRVSAQSKIRAIIDSLRLLPGNVQQVLDASDKVKSLATQFLQRECHKNAIILIGRGFQYATAREAALKIKEISYIHCEALMAGELKHGPLALVDEHTNIFMIVTHDSVYDKTLNALRLVVARAGRPLLIVTEGDEEVVMTAAKVGSGDATFIRENMLIVPATHESLQGILNIIPYQLLAYYLALGLGHSVDKPRNLAKSVTVE